MKNPIFIFVIILIALCVYIFQDIKYKEMSCICRVGEFYKELRTDPLPSGIVITEEKESLINCKYISCEK